MHPLKSEKGSGCRPLHGRIKKREVVFTHSTVGKGSGHHPLHTEIEVVTIHSTEKIGSVGIHSTKVEEGSGGHWVHSGSRKEVVVVHSNPREEKKKRGVVGIQLQSAKGRKCFMVVHFRPQKKTVGKNWQVPQKPQLESHDWIDKFTFRTCIHSTKDDINYPNSDPELLPSRDIQ